MVFVVGMSLSFSFLLPFSFGWASGVCFLLLAARLFCGTYTRWVVELFVFLTVSAFPFFFLSFSLTFFLSSLWLCGNFEHGVWGYVFLNNTLTATQIVVIVVLVYLVVVKRGSGLKRTKLTIGAGVGWAQHITYISLVKKLHRTGRVYIYPCFLFAN